MPSKTQRKKRISKPEPAHVENDRKARKPLVEEKTPKRLTEKGLGRFAILLPVGLAFLASANSLWNEFATDDLQQIVHSTFIRKLSNIPLAFVTSVWAFASSEVIFTVDSYYRPLFSAFFTINYALFGPVAWGWHLANVLVHVAVTGMVYYVIKEVTSKQTLALLTAAFFAVHPVHAESVAWTSGITDPLMALFLLPAFGLYVRGRRTGSARLLWFAAGFYLLALLSKETALALPVAIAGLELWYWGVNASKEKVAALWRVLVFVVPTLIYFGLRFNALRTVLFGNNGEQPVASGFRTVPIAFVKYLKLMLVPWGYSYQHYTSFVESFGQWRFVWPIAIIVVVAAGIILLRNREVRFGAVWFIAFLLPALAAIPSFNPEYVVQERYLYIPSIGFCLAVAVAIEWVMTRIAEPKRAMVFAGAVAILLIAAWAGVYARQNSIWHDTLRVYRNCVAVEPYSVESHASLSRGYFEAGRARDAEAEGLRALELDPQGTASVYLNLSFYSHKAGKLNQAIDYLERGAADIVPSAMTRRGLGTVYLNLALLYVQRQQFDLAEQTFLKSIEISPRPVGWYYAGQFYFDQGRLGDARVMYERARDRLPEWFAQVHLRLAKVYDKLGDRVEARASYERFLRVAPSDDEDRADAERRLKRL